MYQYEFYVNGKIKKKKIKKKDIILLNYYYEGENVKLL